MHRLRFIGVAAIGALLAGCFTLLPARGVTPELGSQIAFDVNDAGRVALGPTMGPEIAQIEGRIIEKTSEDYLVAVTTVRLLRGGQQVWSGEKVRLRAEYLGSMYERKFSRGRTVAATAITVGSFATLLGIAAVAGILTDNSGGDGKPTPAGLTRRPPP